VFHLQVPLANIKDFLGKPSVTIVPQARNSPLWCLHCVSVTLQPCLNISVMILFCVAGCQFIPVYMISFMSSFLSSFLLDVVGIILICMLEQALTILPSTVLTCPLVWLVRPAPGCRLLGMFVLDVTCVPVCLENVGMCWLILLD
jgi:hypothetical protein